MNSKQLLLASFLVGGLMQQNIVGYYNPTMSDKEVCLLLRDKLLKDLIGMHSQSSLWRTKATEKVDDTAFQATMDIYKHMKCSERFPVS